MKTIIVGFDGTEAACRALAHAAALADHAEGHVVAVMAHASAEAYAVKGHWIPAEARDIVARSNERILRDVEATFRREVARLEIDDLVAFESIGGRVDDVLARRARTSDLLVLARPEDGTDQHMVQHPDQIVLQSGRPLLVVPNRETPPVDAGPIVVAWDGKRAAARALADALPLLHTGTEIALLTVGDAVLTQPIEQVLSYLARHGFAPRHTVRDSPAKVTQSILEFCAEVSPSLLVMGAYEHSKFQVDLTGGPTSQILRDAHLPVLMAH